MGDNGTGIYPWGELVHMDDDNGVLLDGEIKTPADLRFLHLRMIVVQRDRVNRALEAERQRKTALDRHTSTEIRRLHTMVCAHHQFFNGEVEKPARENSDPGIVGHMLADVFAPKLRRRKKGPLAPL